MKNINFSALLFVVGIIYIVLCSIDSFSASDGYDVLSLIFWLLVVRYGTKSKTIGDFLIWCSARKLAVMIWIFAVVINLAAAIWAYRFDILSFYMILQMTLYPVVFFAACLVIGEWLRGKLKRL